MTLSFRPLTRSDFPLVGRWLAAPHVARWWREPSSATAVERNYGPAVDGHEPTELFVIEYGRRAIGLFQRYRVDDYPEYAQALQPAGTPPASASLDYLIGDPHLTGKGLGPAVIGLASAQVWNRYPEVPAIVIAVQQENRQSWRALEKAGYSREWAGEVPTGDPSDEGPSFVYVLRRGG